MTRSAPPACTTSHWGRPAMCTTTIASKAGSNSGPRVALSAETLLFPLQLAVGFALANASLPGDSFQSVHLADSFRLHQSGNLDCEARSLRFGRACASRRRQHQHDLSPDACPGGKL